MDRRRSHWEEAKKGSKERELSGIEDSSEEEIDSPNFPKDAIDDLGIACVR